MGGQVHPQARNYLLACYAVSLVKGDTIRGRILRHKTIKKYLDAAVKLFVRRGIADPRKAVDTDLVKIILDAVKQYEAVDARRAMISDEMIVDILRRAAKNHPDSLTAALADWIVLGQYTGFRLSEWAQEVCSAYARVGHTSDASAMTRDDFVFKGPNGRTLDQHRLPTFEDIESVDIFWRHQKNGDNGEDIEYTRNRQHPQLCGVAAAFRIVARATRLNNPSHHPLGVYAGRNGITFITGADTALFLRDVAATVFNPDPTKSRDTAALSRYSAHSIRVRAANILHRQGMSDSYIQKRLRWKSTTFLNYLRNTIYAADKHNTAMGIPNSHLPDLLDRVGQPIPRFRPLRTTDSFSALAAAASAA